MNHIDRTQTRAAIANSVRRAESLSPDDRLMHRAVIDRQRRAKAVIASWEGRLAWSDRIVHASVEVLNG